MLPRCSSKPSIGQGSAVGQCATACRWRKALLPPKRVCSGSRFSPAALAPAAPSSPSGSSSSRPSICRPPQMPSTAPPPALKRCSSRARPLACRALRSRRVCLLPGSTTASGWPRASPGCTQRSCTLGSASSGSRSEKLLREGSRNTAISSSALALRPRRSNRSRESSGGKSSSSQGITPSTGTPVLSESQLTPGSNSSWRPRKRLINRPFTRGRSTGRSNCKVPTSWAKTPPRSISATSRQRARRYWAKRRLVRSRCCRFTSTGLPAPSSTNRPWGCCCRNCSSPWRIASHPGLNHSW